jgi:hypothetical protein
MKAGKCFIVIAALTLLMSSVAMAQSIAANKLCIHNGGESWTTAYNHEWPNRGGGKYYPSFLHIPAQSKPWTTDTWTWKISGWGVEGVKLTPTPSHACPW